MKDSQAQVRAFLARHGLGRDAEVHALDLMAEVGEVAKEILLESGYGEEEVEISPELEEEIGDTAYSLLALAEALGVDAGAALRAALEKYEARLAEGEGPGSGRA